VVPVAEQAAEPAELSGGRAGLAAAGARRPRAAPAEPARREVLGYPLVDVGVEGLIDVLVGRAAAGRRTTAAYLNAHTWNLADRDAEFRRALLACDVLYADGISLVWAARRLGSPLPERMTSADYAMEFARRCAEHGLSLYLLGGGPGIAAAAGAALAQAAPGLRVAGARHGFFGDGDSAAVIDEINAAAPDVLLVGMGSPRQERWLVDHAGALGAPLGWCVGALFDYLAGVERRAPRWMCRMGLEWLFRLAVDPEGKWRRYLVGNARFVWRVLSARRTTGRIVEGGGG